MYNNGMNTQNTPKIERFATLEATNEAAVTYLNDLLAQHVDKPVLLLLAGGSSVQLYNHINPEYLSADLTVTVTDDRFSQELDVNNFAILQATEFYDELIQVDAFCINTQPNSGETIEECAKRFERNIRDWKKDFPNGVVIAVYGMGKDGHTGGMIPGVLSSEEFEKKFINENVWVSAIDAKNKIEYPLRFTTTTSFMKNVVDHALFYITGEQKKSALMKAFDMNTVYSEIPARIILDMKDTVVFTDITE